MSACPDCGRERVETMEAFWKNPDYSCPVDVPRTECNDTNWLEVYCLEGNVSRLEAALAERDKRIAELEEELTCLRELRDWTTVQLPQRLNDGDDSGGNGEDDQGGA